jgi:hypothetical protein
VPIIIVQNVSFKFNLYHWMSRNKKKRQTSIEVYCVDDELFRELIEMWFCSESEMGKMNCLGR